MGGFILIGAGISMTTEPRFGTDFSSNIINEIGGLAFIYGGLSAIMVGILLIWALVKSGQIENIDKNIEIIAKWAKSQMQKDGSISKEWTKDDKFESIK